MTKFVIYRAGDRVFITTKKNEIEVVNAIKDYPNYFEFNDIEDYREEINGCGLEIMINSQVNCNAI